MWSVSDVTSDKLDMVLNQLEADGLMPEPGFIFHRGGRNYTVLAGSGPARNQWVRVKTMSDKLATVTESLDKHGFTVEPGLVFFEGGSDFLIVASRPDEGKPVPDEYLNHNQRAKARTVVVP